MGNGGHKNTLYVRHISLMGTTSYTCPPKHWPPSPPSPLITYVCIANDLESWSILGPKRRAGVQFVNVNIASYKIMVEGWRTWIWILRGRLITDSCCCYIKMTFHPLKIFSWSIYIFAIISLANYYDNITGNSFIVVVCIHFARDIMVLAPK